MQARTARFRPGLSQVIGARVCAVCVCLCVRMRVCVCVCVQARERVCMCECVMPASGPPRCPTRHQIGARWQ